MTEENVEEVQTEELLPEVENQEEEAQEQSPQWTAEDEEKARKFHWKSPDEWQGEKPPGYIEDPKEYVERVERHPIYKTLASDIQSMKAEQAEAIRKLNAVNDRIHQEQKAAYERQLEALKAEQAQAFENGDIDAFKDATDRREALRPPAEPQPDVTPEDDAKRRHQEFITAYQQTEEGKWTTDPFLRAQGSQIIEMNPAILQADAKTQVEFARSHLEKAYPHMFGKQPAATPRAAKVDGGGISSSGHQATDFLKLPQDARDQFALEVKRGRFKDDKEGRQRYADYYNEA